MKRTGYRQVAGPLIAGSFSSDISETPIRAIGAALMPLAFDRVYSHHFERVIHSGAKQILQSSVERYAAAIGGAYDPADPISHRQEMK